MRMNMGDQPILVMGITTATWTHWRKSLRIPRETFDFVIHVGGLTNAYLDGLEAGVQQL